MKRKKKKERNERKEIIKYGLGITALCLCWLTFKHTNTLELVVGIISLAYLIILAICETIRGFLNEEKS